LVSWANLETFFAIYRQPGAWLSPPYLDVIDRLALFTIGIARVQGGKVIPILEEDGAAIMDPQYENIA